VAAFVDVPGHDGLAPGQTDFAVGEAWAGVDIAGAGFEVIARNVSRRANGNGCQHKNRDGRQCE
jgi:hypothetical protein